MSNTRTSNYFVHTLLRARDWQHRPQFDEVCNWWRGGGQGVCALVGMGGAGKTAIADRFLNELLDNHRRPDPGRDNAQEQRERDQRTSTVSDSDRRTAATAVPAETAVARSGLPLTPSIFVYSFYDDDKPENFFRHLQIWLEGTSAPDKQKSPTQLMFDIQQHQGLIILDGLERVQESGARGGFGRLTSPSLRDLLNHIACGAARELSVLVTSRFPLTDLRDSQPRFFHTIAVDQIDVWAGIALLRDRGVRGTDMQLAPIVEHCGRHALTIDLAGGYIKEYGHGDPSTPLNLGTAEELQVEAEQEPDDDKRVVLQQGIRFARIAQRYREAMLDSDEAALALLERICLFRLGVDCETLAAIFTGPNAENVSGKALASLDADQLQAKLDWLVQMRIVEQSGAASSISSPDSAHYAIHPSVRDGFLSGIGRELATASHEAVLKDLEVALGEIPGDHPSDAPTLNLLEEIVYHTIETGFVERAWDVYWYRIGGFENLGAWHGEYERGDRLCRAFVDEMTPSECANHLRSTRKGVHLATTPFHQLPECEQSMFIFEWAAFLRTLGRLSEAVLCIEVSENIDNRDEDWGNAAMTEWALALAHLELGRLSKFLRSADASLRFAHRADEVEVDSDWEESNDVDEYLISDEQRKSALRRIGSDLTDHFALRAHARTQRGECALALADFRTAERHEALVRDGAGQSHEQLLRWFGSYYVTLLNRIGRIDEAFTYATLNMEYCINVSTDPETDPDIPRCCLVLADLPSERLDESARLRRLARDWAAAHNAKEVLCWASLVQGRIELLALSNQRSGSHCEHTQHVTARYATFAEGLKIAHDCGYGLYHIDLLLERARLHLLRGDAEAALDDIEVALDTGIPANEETGQVELLAANHEECGYAWAIPAGFQLRAESLLLQAAQTLGSTNISRRALAPGSSAAGSTTEPDASAFRLIQRAESCLHEALDLWQPLHDPEPERDDQNFKLNGKDYNYRAAETNQVLMQLEAGVLT
jgi:tetratricopeptide (TPR) repeat protein